MEEQLLKDSQDPLTQKYRDKLLESFDVRKRIYSGELSVNEGLRLLGKQNTFKEEILLRSPI